VRALFAGDAAHTARASFHPVPLFANYRKVSSHPEFQWLSLAVALNFAGFFLYIASAPTVILQHLHLGEHEFGWLFIPAVSASCSAPFFPAA